jgi:hypothetical protein
MFVSRFVQAQSISCVFVGTMMLRQHQNEPIYLADLGGCLGVIDPSMLSSSPGR